MGFDTLEDFKNTGVPQPYLTATLTVNVSRAPGATRWSPTLFSGALAGPIQGSTQ
jgi:hypothetical protein